MVDRFPWRWVEKLGYEMGTCSTCRHWPDAPADADARPCQLLNRPGVVLVTANGQPVTTHKDFGCNLWIDKGLDLSEWHK